MINSSSSDKKVIGGSDKIKGIGGWDKQGVDK